jgi:hypothetical protein
MKRSRTANDPWIIKPCATEVCRTGFPDCTNGYPRGGIVATSLSYVPIDSRSSQIASHLLPLDILQLARISKTLNDLLMSKNSKHIWRAARSNTDLPECPDNLSEPMYAALVYENICQVCLIKLCALELLRNHNLNAPLQKCGCRTDIDPSFALRMRLCRTCYVLSYVAYPLFITKHIATYCSVCSVKRGYYLLWSVMRVKHHILIFAIVPNEERKHSLLTIPTVFFTNVRRTVTSPDDIDFELGTVSSGGKCISSDHFSRNNHCASQLREVVKQFEALQEYPDRLKAYAKACYLRKLEIDRVRTLFLSVLPGDSILDKSMPRR